MVRLDWAGGKGVAIPWVTLRTWEFIIELNNIQSRCKTMGETKNTKDNENGRSVFSSSIFTLGRRRHSPPL